MKKKILNILSLKKTYLFLIIVLIVIGIIFAILFANDNKNNTIENNFEIQIKKDNEETEIESTIINDEENSLDDNLEETIEETSDNNSEEAIEETSDKSSYETVGESNEQLTSKTIETIEIIAFSQSTQNEVNMLRGTTKIYINGEEGKKIVKYEAYYDSNNNEISRKIISETIIKEPVNEVIKVGTSDYNINTDTYSILNGYICSSDQLSDIEGCGYSGMMYCAIVLKDTRYLTHIRAGTGGLNCYQNDSNKISEKIVMEPGNPIGRVNYNNELLYYDIRAGIDDQSLTEEICNKYDLSCGRW